jgi:hypothetical protein
MASQFEETLRRGREEAREKLKIIAPKYEGNIIESGITRGGGGGGSSRSVSEEIARRKALKAQAEAQAKAQAEARAKLKEALADAELKRILKERNRIVAAEAIKRVQESRDARTGDNLKITTWRKGGNTIRKVENLDKGYITYNKFSPGRGGGSVRQTGGVTVSSTPTTKESLDVVAFNIKTMPSNIPGKVTVVLSNGQKYDINSKGRTTIGKNIAGKKYVFENGKIISIDGKWVDGRDIYEPVQTVLPVSKPTGAVNRIMKKINDIQKKSATASIRNKQSDLINELSLFGLTVGITLVNGGTAFVALPKTVFSLVKNPSQIKGAYRSIKRSAEEFGQLIRISPTEALGIIAGEALLFAGTGGAFKIIGKLSPAVLRSIDPFIRKADKIKFIIKGKTVRFAKKVPVIKSILKKSASIKKIQAKEISRFKSAVEYSKQLKRARAIRKAARKKIKTINIGNRDFIDAVAYVEEVADNIAKIKAKQILNNFKKSGGKLGLGKEQEFINSIRNYVKQQLNKSPRFKALKEYSRLTEPYQIRLLKANKISYANKIAKEISFKIKNFKITKYANKVLKSIKKRVIKINKSPQRLKKYITKKRQQRSYRKEFMKTNRYRMEKARPIKKITIDRLKQSSSIQQYKSFVDNFFDEISRRRKVDLSSLKYRQFKNKIKKKLTRAIRSGNTEEVKKFIDSVKKIYNEMNKPSGGPTVKVISKSGGKTTRKVINNFKPDVKKGKYIEVKRGQQVLLQEVKQAQTAKNIKIVKQMPKVYIIEQVQKQSINLRPLMSFLSFFGMKLKTKQKSRQSLRLKTRSKQKSRQKSRQSLRLKTRSKQKSRQVSRLKTRSKQKSRQKSRQKFKSAQDFLPRVNQASKSKMKRPMKLLKELKQTKKKKKKDIRLNLGESFVKKSLPKKVQTYYVVEKVRGKFKKLYPKPLTAKDAKDYAVYSIDNRLSKTAFFIPLGKSKTVVRPPKPIQNYYSKNVRKFRPYKIRYGKRKQLVNGFIEKRKYFQDTAGEKAQLRALKRTKSSRRSTPKRKMSPQQRKILIQRLKKARAVRMKQIRRPTRRSSTPKRTSVKRKMSPTQRRILLLRLKKARAVRMRNLRKR